MSITSALKLIADKYTSEDLNYNDMTDFERGMVDGMSRGDDVSVTAGLQDYVNDLIIEWARNDYFNSDVSEDMSDDEAVTVAIAEGELNILTPGNIEAFTNTVMEDLIEDNYDTIREHVRESPGYTQGFQLTYPMFYTLTARRAIPSLLRQLVTSYNIYEEGFLSEHY